MDIFRKQKNDSGQEEMCRIPLTLEEREALSKKHLPPPKMSDITWRIFRIMAEFVEGFQFLSTLNKEVTILGSARTPEDNKWYAEAVKLGKILAENGFTVVTGGGPGIMEAANRGAHEAGGVSVGINIQLPMEQRINPYVNKSRGFYYFFTRKVILAASAQAYVYFPGGYGTQDELFEILTLMQTKKSDQLPIVLVGKDYWEPWQEFVEKTLFKDFEAISREDLDLYQIVDTAEEAFELIKATKERSIF